MNTIYDINAYIFLLGKTPNTRGHNKKIKKQHSRLSTHHYHFSQRVTDWRNKLPKEALQWRHYECDGVSNHHPHDCLLNCLFKAQIKETSKLCVSGLCEGNSPMTGESPAQRASSAENASVDDVIMSGQRPIRQQLQKHIKLPFKDHPIIYDHRAPDNPVSHNMPVT